jgi:hypothetical protein
MFEKILKKEVVETAKELVKDKKTIIIAGAVVLVIVGLIAIRQTRPVTIVNNYVWAGGCWSPYHIPGGFVK